MNNLKEQGPCGFCDGDHSPQDCKQLQQTVERYGDA
jgi:hypothetical protein